MLLLPLVLAHAGKVTWDEFIFMAIPVVILAVLGWQAKRKGSNGDEDNRPKG
jgi:hypothetical protein